MIAIIPARSGSKGVPGKNIKLLNAKPLIAYTIEAAKQSHYVSRIILSTDSHEIAKIGMSYGAEVPFLRPMELSTDNSEAVDTYLYTIDRLQREENIKISNIVVLLPTSPLRKPEDIDAAVSIFVNKNADSVISYTKEDHPIQWHKFINPDGSFENIFEDSIRNRQEHKPTYYPNGSIYVFKSDLLRTRKYYSDKSFGYIMPKERSIDIDSQLDFYIGEVLLKDDYGYRKYNS